MQQRLEMTHEIITHSQMSECMPFSAQSWQYGGKRKPEVGTLYCPILIKLLQWLLKLCLHYERRDAIPSVHTTGDFSPH